MGDFKHIFSPLVLILFGVIFGPIMAISLMIVSHSWWYAAAWPAFTISATGLVYLFEVFL